MTADLRQTAVERIGRFLEILNAQPDRGALERLVREGEHLQRSIGAFHMEAIRFRMFTIDRLLATEFAGLPAEAHQVFRDAKIALEAAGFHVRSH